MYISEEEYLKHFGVMGMKWGIRSGRGTTGVSRLAGAKIDQNDRRISRIKTQQKHAKESGFLRNSVRYGEVGALLLKSKRFQKKMETKVSELTSQNERFKSGTETRRDRASAALTTGDAGKYISVRPK